MELVSSLIITESASWNNDLINSLFPPYEVAMIFSIPLCGRLPSNSLMWHYDPKGLSYVKSAYKVDVSLRNLASPSNQSITGTSIWKKSGELRFQVR